MPDLSYFFNNTAMSKILDCILEEEIKDPGGRFTTTWIAKHAHVSFRNIHAHIAKLVEFGVLEKTDDFHVKHHVYDLQKSQMTMLLFSFKNKVA